ncbi:uncharacterized protein LOC114347424 [Diabrotica virgifera virgifera]|uniref:Uncharacterized protein LOC114347424 n=1 Tax=Diabrotica virgifera virgifera TaxID=50390 RepID=A0A6P7H5V8_DIAVI|nr:uncharacterized protein LOC114347424 [Diabrotica virgifera virgifera]
MMCKLLLATLAVYLCLEAASAQHATGFNPNQNRQPHATGLIVPNGYQRHATGLNPGRRTGRVYRDLSSADTGRNHRKILGAHANSNGPTHPGLPLAPGPVIHPH